MKTPYIPHGCTQQGRVEPGRAVPYLYPGTAEHLLRATLRCRRQLQQLMTTIRNRSKT
jgi:hypothetical protein